MNKRTWWIVGALATLFTIIIGGLQWWKYSTFGYNGLDLAIYNQAVWSLAHGHGFASSIHDPSYLGDHLEVWLLPISWCYRFWESPLHLLWLQTIVIASSIIPLAKVTHRALGSRATIIATTLFIVHPLVYNAALYEFHALVFALPLALWLIWFYLDNRLGWWLVASLGLVVVREDMPFIVAGLALMAAIDRRSWKWFLPPLLMAVIWFPAAQTIIRSVNHDGVYKYLAFYGWMGSSMGEILTFPFRHPLVFLLHTVTVNNLGTVVGMLVTLGFLPLLKLRRLWPLSIIFIQLLLGNAQPAAFLKIHYPVPYLPFLFWAAIEAYQDIRQGRLVLKRIGASLSVTVATLFIIVGPLYSSLIVGPLMWPWVGTLVKPSTAPNILQQALSDVQPSDRVLTTFAYLPNFSNRPSLYSLNYLYLGRRQYSEIPYVVPSDIDVAVIDWQQLYEYQFLYRTTVFENKSGLQRIRDLLDRQGLSVVKRYGSVVVYRHGGQPDTTVMPITIKPDEPRTPMGAISLLGQPQINSANGELHITSRWLAMETKQDALVSIKYILRQGGKIVWQQSKIIGQGLTPVSEWPVNTAWSTTDTVLLPVSLRGDINVSAEVVIPQGRYRLNRRQIFRPIIDDQKTLGAVALGRITL